MLFDQINQEHIAQAVAVFEEKGFPAGLSDSAYYNILFKGKEYPPKPILAYANQLATGKEPGNYFEGGFKKPAFNQLEFLGVPIIEKNAQKKLLGWIEKYKNILRNPENYQYNEWYKWRAFEHFKANWPTSLTVSNIQEALAKSFLQEAGNLWSGSHYLPLKVIQELAEENPEHVAGMLNGLFDETSPINERLIDFASAAEEAFSALRPEENLDHYQSDRAMSLYLSMRYPDKYYLYKAGMYSDFCAKTDFVKFPSSRKGIPYKKALHFYEIAEAIKPLLLQDTKLLELHKARMEDSISFNDENLLTQDFIYAVANYLKEEDASTSHWVFQGNPAVFDFKKALSEGTLNDWTVSAHKEEIKPGDKVILWITGDQAGCYALAEILSEPYAKSSNEDDRNWKEPNEYEFKTDLKITHNLKDKPILWETIKDDITFKNFKAGNRGTNFSATESEYEFFKEMSEQENFQVWIYAPGEKAHKWEEFYKSGEMALGWDGLGDLNQYSSREAIKEALDKHDPKKGDRKNDISANDDFLNKMKVGDMVISKKGRKELLGFGWVSSDYYHEDSVSSYTSRRKVNWQIKGSWKTDHDLVLKTLTDLTKYSSNDPLYEKYYEQLLDTMGVNLKGPHHQNAYYKWLRNQYGNSGTAGSYVKAIQLLSKTLQKRISQLRIKITSQHYIMT